MTKTSLRARPWTRSALLAIELRAARIHERRGLNELARRVGVAKAVLSSWEHAERTPHLEDVAGILGALGVIGERKARILELARHPDSDSIIFGRRGLPRHFALAEVCARAAERIVEWHPLLVPDLLRTVDYSLSVARSLPPQARPETEHIRAHCDANNAILTDKEACVYIGEQALTHPMGDATVVAEQLRRLIRIQQANRRVSVRVVPNDIGSHIGLSGTFTGYDTAVGRIVHRPLSCCGEFLLDGDGLYADLDAQLGENALTAADSTAFIARHAMHLVTAAS
ncbi:helix-turn-helix transcriptional regulator [Amycolatopsis sp. FU40]|uniref:Scr1 family TA system antitoxin-like transcriptional regulator n=1 Tax=Amycolatopsis sp. FU40 TaxID=2914159 RepID=UPI001F204234|nr:Scr1 family TA system antitoxin-like transcriptional regulator [Amycolatopsis sp. FU40]UKD51051.1 helix-turn-helix transcriptional regulator [Amycolatopsis sp. FU40]